MLCCAEFELELGLVGEDLLLCTYYERGYRIHVLRRIARRYEGMGLYSPSVKMLYYHVV